LGLTGAEPQQGEAAITIGAGQAGIPPTASQLKPRTIYIHLHFALRRWPAELLSPGIAWPRDFGCDAATPGCITLLESGTWTEAHETELN
jgi:hypothetical protein